MKIGIVRLILTLTFVVAAGFHAKAGAPINFVGYKNQSAPIFSKAGPTTINYQLYAEYTGIHKPGVGLVTDGFIDIVVSNTNGSLFYLHRISFGSEPAVFGGHLDTEFQPYLLTTGSFQFSNPSDQNLIIEEAIFYNRPLIGLPGFQSEEWGEAPGQSLVSGGDTPEKPPGGIGGRGGGSIHAVIISGRSDLAKIVTSQNVTLTGGVVALGKDSSPPAAPTAWSSGLRIVPDEALLTGGKIPPLTSNIIDVRIMKHEVVGDLPSPSASPSP